MKNTEKSVPRQQNLFKYRIIHSNDPSETPKSEKTISNSKEKLFQTISKSLLTPKALKNSPSTPPKPSNLFKPIKLSSSHPTIRFNFTVLYPSKTPLNPIPSPISQSPSPKSTKPVPKPSPFTQSPSPKSTKPAPNPKMFLNPIQQTQKSFNSNGSRGSEKPIHEPLRRKSILRRRPLQKPIKTLQKTSPSPPTTPFHLIPEKSKSARQHFLQKTTQLLNCKKRIASQNNLFATYQKLIQYVPKPST